MASCKDIIRIIGTGLFIHACVLMRATARPSGSSDTSLQNAEKLLTEALKKEIDDVLSEPVSRSKSTRGSPDTDVFAEVLEEAVKGIENNYADGRRDAVKRDKAIGHNKARMGANSFEGSEMEGPTKIGNAAHGQERKHGKNMNRHGNGLKGGKMPKTDFEVPIRYDLSDLQVHSPNQGSPMKSHLGSAFGVAKPNEPQNPSQKSKQSIYSGKVAKAEISAHSAGLPQTRGKSSSNRKHNSDDDIASKISEFYKILEDYAEENDMQAEPVYEPINVAKRQQALPLDQPMELNSNGDGYKEKKTWSQKRTENNQKLAAEIEKLAATLKQTESDSSDDEFPSLPQWLWHHRGISNSKQGEYVAPYEHPRSNHNEEDDVFRTGDKQDSEMSYPWSKYFREIQGAGHSSKHKGRRDYTESEAEEKFMNEIEARVAELQQQLGAKRHRSRVPTLRM